MVGSTASCQHSRLPLAIMKVVVRQRQAIFERLRDPKQSTDFSCPVFLVPRMFDDHGWALFKCYETILRDDIVESRTSGGELCAVQSVLHEHVSGETVQFLGEVHSADPKKNCNSLMLHHCGRHMSLTPVYWNHLVDGRPAEAADPGEGGPELLCPGAWAPLPLPEGSSLGNEL